MTRERFTTGGGSQTNSETDELSDVLSGIVEHLQPLDGALDNEHLDNSDENLTTNGKYSQENVNEFFWSCRILYCLYQSLFFLYMIVCVFIVLFLRAKVGRVGAQCARTFRICCTIDERRFCYQLSARNKKDDHR